jgi:ABC-type methionine transport system ATPase subunit
MPPDPSTTDQDSPALALSGVQRRVQTNGKVNTIFDGLDLAVERGDVVNIVGPSGSGKTTLLRLINRLDEADGGQIDILGRSLDGWSISALRQAVGMVFQEPSLLGMTVEQNLRLPHELAKHEGADHDEPRIERVLELVGLEDDLLDREESQLSVGQRQRVVLARALVLDPSILLMDEPTASLDQRSAARLLDNIARLQDDNGLTILLVTHRLGEARRVGGKTAVLMDGRVAALAPTQEIFEAPPTDDVAHFLQAGEEGNASD